MKTKIKNEKIVTPPTNDNKTEESNFKIKINCFSWTLINFHES
jgi:hypothetical protein